MGDNKENRIVVLDAIRGFAILGIFLVNMLTFHSPFQYINPLTWWESSADQLVYKFINVFAEGSFYPLFSLLFGYGLVLLREKTIDRGLNFQAVALRRLTVLFMFGIIHAFLIWYGDILITYAVIGFIFLLFLRVSARGLFLTGGLMALIFNLLMTLLMVLAVLTVPEEELTSSMYPANQAEQAVHAYQEGSLAEISEQRLKDWFLVNNPFNGIALFFMILPYFLIGGGAAKLKWMERIEELKKPFVYAFVVIFTLGLSLKFIPYIFDYNLATKFVSYSFGGPMLAMAYALGMALLSRTGLNKAIQVFSHVGRMSLTNYIMQSVLATFIFYSYGLGLFGKVSVVWGTVLVFVIYGLQIIFSILWMKHFRYGPLEWVWRTAIYWKKQPFRVRS